MAVEQTVDEMEVAGAAAAGADSKIAGQLRLRAGGESSRLLVARMDPVDRAIGAQGVGDPIEGIAGDAVNSANPGGLQSFDQKISDSA